MASVILRMIVDTEIFNNKMARAMLMPILIKEHITSIVMGFF